MCSGPSWLSSAEPSMFYRPLGTLCFVQIDESSCVSQREKERNNAQSEIGKSRINEVSADVPIWIANELFD
jgi:hypothetical protein